jgi:hypothetical protein
VRSKEKKEEKNGKVRNEGRNEKVRNEREEDIRSELFPSRSK